MILDTEELDETLVEYVNDHIFSKSRIQNLYNGIATAVPKARNNLPWVLAIIHGMQKSQPGMHTIPMVLPAAIIIAVYLSQCGYQRIAVVLLMQATWGMRPSEALAIFPNSVTLPGTGFYRNGIIVIKQGSHTKSGRPESVLINPNKHWLITQLIQWCISTGPPNVPFAGNFRVDRYSKLLGRASRALKLPPYTAHGPRAGFVSDAMLDGVSVADAMTVTRHQSLKSFQVYADAATAIAHTSKGPLVRWLPVVRDICCRPHLYFPQFGYRTFNLMQIEASLQ